MPCAKKYSKMYAKIKNPQLLKRVKSSLFYLGLDRGDRLALDARFKPTAAPPCQYDKEDLRFVMKGST